MSNKIRKAILGIRPDLGDLDGYLYFRPVGHVLCGFACEARPEGTRIVPYAFPLYSGEKELHLSFGDPLDYPEDLIESPKGGQTSAAREFVLRMERHEARIRALENLDDFAKYIEATKPLQNPWIRRGYALTLIMLGKAEEAEGQLQILRSQSATARYAGFDAAIAEISADLAHGIDAARARLDTWEAQVKEHLHLS